MTPDKREERSYPKKLNCQHLYAMLDLDRTEAELSWRALAAEMNISPSVFTRLKQGRKPDADTLLTMLYFTGLSINEVTL